MEWSPNEKNDADETIYLSQLPDVVQQDILSMIEYIMTATNLMEDNDERSEDDSECN